MRLHHSVLPALVLLRHSLPQTFAGKLFGVSQPTVSRGYAPLLGQVTSPHTPPMPEALARRVATVDGTLLHVADPVEGRTHDRHAFTTVGYDTLLAHTAFLGDLGHQGTTAIPPRRKRPGHIRHTPEDKIRKRLLTTRRAAWRVPRRCPPVAPGRDRR